MSWQTMICGYVNKVYGVNFVYIVCEKSAPGLSSVHPETPDEKLLVSESERGDFLSWQGNQGIARRPVKSAANFRTSES